MIIKVKVTPPFVPLLRHELDNYREIIFRGGRGGGKTKNIVGIYGGRFLEEKGANILCLREHKNSSQDSIKAEFDEFFRGNQVDTLSVENGVIKQTINRGKSQRVISLNTQTIINNINGNRMIFMGITKQTVMAIKSIPNLKYCIIEEGDFIGEREYNILKPTIRAEGGQIIILFNPQSEDDFIYQLSQIPSPRRYVRLVNLDENPLAPKVLKDDREEDRLTKPIWEYEHIWEGEPLRNVEGVIFSDDTRKKLTRQDTTFYQEGMYSKVIIAIDPATTSKDFSNEYGIIVLGLDKQGNVCVIDDLSQVCTPEQFASIVEEAYFDYGCEYAVVETNQGGDFIKSTLIVKNPHIRVKEVRASKDKVNRATPVANIASLGRIMLLNENRHHLLNQMKRLTNKGYIGKKGESPDRLDAMVWGCYDLLGITEAGTQGTIFKKDLLGAKIGGITIMRNVALIYFEGSEYGMVVCTINDDGDYRFIFTHSLKGEIINLANDIKNKIGISLASVYINDVGLEEAISEIDCGEVNLFENPTLPIEEISLKALPLLKSSVNVLECQNFEFNGINRNWLLFDLLNFDKENRETYSTLVRAFCAIILELRG